VKSEILLKQLNWATRAGLEPDERGYLSNYEQNLFRPLNEKSKAAFDNGSGSELRDRLTSPAKMRALHSSSALAVNFFDTWIGKGADTLAQVLDLEPNPIDIRFEGQYPTGLPGNPPNLDVIIEFENDFVVGIESKFTEWLTPKSVAKAPFKDKYFPDGSGVWEKVGLTETQRLANDIQSKALTFRHLDAPQLMKHALGLATHQGSAFRLYYIYFDAEGNEATAHRLEISTFSERLSSELGFKAISYQNLLMKMQKCSGVPSAYLEYLCGRYL